MPIVSYSMSEENRQFLKDKSKEFRIHSASNALNTILDRVRGKQQPKPSASQNNEITERQMRYIMQGIVWEFRATNNPQTKMLEKVFIENKKDNIKLAYSIFKEHVGF